MSSLAKNFPTPLRWLAFAATLGLALLLAPAQTVQLTVQPGDPKLLISKDIQGQFAEHLGRCIYGGFWVCPGLSVLQG